MGPTEVSPAVEASQLGALAAGRLFEGSCLLCEETVRLSSNATTRLHRIPGLDNRR